jgi:transposase
MTIMLAGVAIGVRKDAAPATTISVSTGCGDTPVSTGRADRHRRHDEHRGRPDHLTERGGQREQRDQQQVRASPSMSKTPREIRRCLKRYIARELNRQLTQSMTPANRP